MKDTLATLGTQIAVMAEHVGTMNEEMGQLRTSMKEHCDKQIENRMAVQNDIASLTQKIDKVYAQQYYIIALGIVIIGIISYIAVYHP